jgi:hypothetical protein
MMWLIKSVVFGAGERLLVPWAEQFVRWPGLRMRIDVGQPLRNSSMTADVFVAKKTQLHQGHRHVQLGS